LGAADGEIGREKGIGQTQKSKLTNTIVASSGTLIAYCINSPNDLNLFHAKIQIL
jgi:hypothetical protein